MQRTGTGLAGLFNDIKKVIPFSKFIRSYVQKMRTSSAFIGFVNQLKSYNFQQLVNKVYQINSFQIIVNGLKSRGVNTQLVADIMYIVLGITVPNNVSVYQNQLLVYTVIDEIMDFVKLIPVDLIAEIISKYTLEDEKVQNALLYLSSSEFHFTLRNAEALKEFKTLVVYLEKAGLSVIDLIKTHETIGTKGYVPPKIESIFESQIGIQKIDDGMKGLLLDIYDVLPIDKMAALYEEKLQNSKVFADFVEKIKSPEMQKIIDDLYANQTYKDFVMISREKGLDFEVVMKLITKIFGLKFPY